MSHESEHTPWPHEAGDRKALPTELQPPAALEDRIVETLAARGLIHQDGSAVRRHVGWRVMRASFAVAAGAALLAIGVLVGRISTDGTAAISTALTGAETDLYALLLYETAGYDRPSAAEALGRYGEYNVWVAEARRRGQFVTGEELEADRGWLLAPAAGGPTVQPATSVEAEAPLGGIFFVRARDADDALALARELPHLKHGGHVIVQKTTPTDTPPE